MNDIFLKIKSLHDEKKLKVAFIRLDSGKENQLENIIQKRLYIGYSSSDKNVFDALVEHKLSADEFKKMVKKGDENHLAPSSLKTIYEDVGNTLWFTVIDGLLYYGFTDQEKKFEKFQAGEKGEHGCIRTMEVDWYNKDIKGNEINERSVSGKITKKRIFRGTTSEVDPDDVRYLVYRILNLDTDEKQLAVESQNNLLGCVQKLLPQLNEYDFETLVEMLFLSQGYEKLAKSSGAEKSFDLVLKRPFDLSEDRNKPTFVQIKSTVDKKIISKVFDDFIIDKSFRDYHHTGFLVSHSFDEKLGSSYSDKSKDENKKLLLIGPAVIARQCVEFGSVDWLLAKVV